MSAPTRPAGARLDLELSPDRYTAVAEALHRIAGIRLGPGKRALVVSRLGPRVRATGARSLDAYVDETLRGGDDTELSHFVDVLTTNKSAFFREPAHFDHLRDSVFPRLERTARPLRFWSAGCAAGEEPYTLAMVARDALSAPALARTRILATDISHRILAAAREARYGATQRDGVPPAQLARHFDVTPAADGTRRVNEPTRDLVRFAWLNLIGDWPMRGTFDVILCRNVMIYFDRPTQERLVARLGSLLVAGGFLYVGHAESLTGVPHTLEPVIPSVYRKPGADV